MYVCMYVYIYTLFPHLGGVGYHKAKLCNEEDLCK